MTSKEALKQLRKYNSVGLCGDKTLFEPIEKDLEILEILKKCEDEKHSLYCVYVLNALSSGKITQDDVINVKEWLDA